MACLAFDVPVWERQRFLRNGPIFRVAASKFAWRSDYAMISVNCVAERDGGRGLPVLLARQLIGDDSVVADCRRIPSGCRGGEHADAKLGARL